MQSMSTNNPVALARGGNARFAAKFITFVRLALGDELHLGGVYAVNLVLAGAGLLQQAMGQC